MLQPYRGNAIALVQEQGLFVRFGDFGSLWISSDTVE